MNARAPLPPEYFAFPATGDDKRWMELMTGELHGWSKHSGTKHVSVITGPDGEFRALGYNGLPRGVDDGNAAFAVHPLKRQMTMCAERNALRNLQLMGGSAEGCTLHADAVPCDACAREIVASGIKTVVMVDAQVHSTVLQDSFWRDGLERLVAHDLQLRHHDPAGLKCNPAMLKHYHPPIPSGSVDWDSRYLLLAKRLEDWVPGSTGEVIAMRHGAEAAAHDKITRALGCWSANGALPFPDSLADASMAGLSVKGCTMYLSRPDRLADAQNIVGSGIVCVVMDKKFETAKRVKTLRGDCEALGLEVNFYAVLPQDFASLVARLAEIPPQLTQLNNDRPGMTLKPQIQ